MPHQQRNEDTLKNIISSPGPVASLPSPTGLPGESVRVMALPEAPLPSSYGRQRDNATAVQALIDRTGLPAPTVVAQPDAVHVVLADVDDLALWRAELDGRVRADVTPWRTVEWTLFCQLSATRRRGAVLVVVHALAVVGQDVLPSLRDAAGVAALGALPMPVGPEPESLEARERVELLTGLERALAPFCADPKAAAVAAAGARHCEAEWLLRDAEVSQARVTELEAELAALKGRLAELEDLTPAAIQTCRVCGAGYTLGEPCSTCAFQARMAAETASLREPEPEFHAWLHHENRVGHDLPETGGTPC
jgi:hypothetical protein